MQKINTDKKTYNMYIQKGLWTPKETVKFKSGNQGIVVATCKMKKNTTPQDCEITISDYFLQQNKPNNIRKESTMNKNNKIKQLLKEEGIGWDPSMSNDPSAPFNQDDSFYEMSSEILYNYFIEQGKSDSEASDLAEKVSESPIFETLVGSESSETAAYADVDKVGEKFRTEEKQKAEGAKSPLLALRYVNSKVKERVIEYYLKKDIMSVVNKPEFKALVNGESLNEGESVKNNFLICTLPGLIQVSKDPSGARSADVKVGDKFIVDSESKYFYLGHLEIKGKFSHQPGLSGKKTDPKPFDSSEIVLALNRNNVDGTSSPDGYWAQFKSLGESAILDESTLNEDIKPQELVPGTVYKVFDKEDSGKLLYSAARFEGNEGGVLGFILTNRPNQDAVTIPADGSFMFIKNPGKVVPQEEKETLFKSKHNGKKKNLVVKKLSEESNSPLEIEKGKVYKLDSSDGSSYSFTVKDIDDLNNKVNIITLISGTPKILGYKQCNNALKSGSLTLVESKVNLKQELIKKLSNLVNKQVILK